MLVGVGVGDSKGEKLEPIDGHSLEPSEWQSTSTPRRSDILPWDLISSVSSSSMALGRDSLSHPYAIAIPQWTGKKRQEESKRVASRALQRPKQGQECCRLGLWSS